MVPEVSIVIPTYNERESILPLVKAITASIAGKWEYELIIVDDNSPDNTGDLVNSLSNNDPHIKLLQRSGKLGLGSAIMDGFSLADGNYWVMMDADLSHNPKDLPRLLDALCEYDIAIGSRYVNGGGVENWPILRRLASRCASLVAKLLVGLPFRDVNSGLAAFRAASIKPILPNLNPHGFKLLLEILVLTIGIRVIEIPVSLEERRYGKSKFSLSEILAFIGLCFRMRRMRHSHTNP